jgi:hypothetical protein
MRYYLQGISVLLMVGVGLIGLVLYVLQSTPIQIISILGGTLLACLFVSSGFIFLYRAVSRDAQTFLKIFLGSIIGRLSLMVILLILILKYGSLEQVSFLISLFTWYFIFQIWELISFNRMGIRNI